MGDDDEQGGKEGGFGKEEGILRNHMLLPDGRNRDSVYYSIIDSEWPEVKKRLEEKMVEGRG